MSRNINSKPSKSGFYCIKATERSSNEKIILVGRLSEKEAYAWKPSSSDKKYYKYFNVAAEK